ncbi:disulfide bond formation protein B [Rhabdothermincola sediminis]|uniref:disulfide bond formation protein B n=1 Tax=Rhabdothermincola sediminis TaxID=2751370 RepID=UPI001AA0A2B7|nr:disulfide bond formation protein B [Rhabdothermincola sediminis]
MGVPTASFFFAVLALCCLGGVAATLIASVVQRVVPSPVLAALRRDVGAASVALAALVAVVATMGSLYYSQVAGFTPCTLCWYQRIFMYSLAVVLIVAAVRRDREVRWYALPLAVTGAGFSVYHSWIQAFPPDSGTSFCTAEAPCTTRHVWEFGFVSLPFMALCGFSFVITMMVLARPAPQEVSVVESTDHELVSL